MFLRNLLSSQRLQQAYIPSKNTSTRTSYQHALSISEILENILAFVSLRDRQRSAQLVNKQWHSICKGLIPITVAWQLCLSDKDNKSMRASLHHAHDLKIYVDKERQSKKLLKSWSLIMKNIKESIVECHQLKLRSLRLMEGVIFDMGVQLPQLPRLPSLTSLKITVNSMWNILDLLKIFVACPNLYELTMKPASGQCSMKQTRACVHSSDARSLDSNNHQPMIHLQSCILYNLMINISDMEAVLRVCPYLSELIILQASHPPSMVPIIDMIKIHCPILKKLHLSSATRKLTRRETTTILKHFPTFEEYSFAVWDVEPVLIRGLLTTANVNYVTTLNFVATRQGFWSHNVNLREILCTFVNLVHLRAPTMNYFCEDMDMHDSYGRMQSLSNESRTVESDKADDSARKYIWACRGLKTLHMSVGYRSVDVGSPQMALTMFGFLSRMCPQLQELHLRRGLLDLSFLGGICLLTRLQDLRRVKISVNTFIRLEKQDFFWLRMEPSIKDKINYTWLLAKTRKQIRSRISKCSKTFDLIRKMQHENRLEIDISKIGIGDDLFDWINERYGDQKLKTWPKLEQFYIECPKKMKGALIQEIEPFVAKIRPEVDIQFRYLNKDYFGTTLQLY